MKFRFHPAARIEFREAVAFYEGRCEGLGGEFAAEVLDRIETILEEPQRWRVFEKDARRCLMGRFPYGILYSIEPGHVLILALMHSSRMPGYWRNRMAD